MEDEQLEQIEEEYRKKSEEMLLAYEEEKLEKELEKNRIGEESKKMIEGLQYKEPFQLEKLVNIETGLEDKTVNLIR